ncbi:MAG: sulfate ABC transporter permease subunit CysT [Planctomycetia bacterium]|nr:sulfate ABC transporter permease subunit CysT [Planctomycetia bacterium]
MATTSRRVLPGFTASLSVTILYLTVLVLIPLAACVMKTLSLSPAEFWAAVWTRQARAAYEFSIGASIVSALVNCVLGLLIAWVLVRYEFPGKRILDSLVDIPFALPTAVAGLVYSSLYVERGWLGQFLVPMGIEAAYTRLGVVVVLVFIGLPFVVRALQPVLESLEVEAEEAAAMLGASRWQTFRWVIVPLILPALVTGFSLSLARALGEYGSVVFVSANRPFVDQIAPMLIVAKLEEFQYGEATAIAVVLLIMSFALLIAVNVLERWSKRHYA